MGRGPSTVGRELTFGWNPQFKRSQGAGLKEIPLESLGEFLPGTGQNGLQCTK